MTPSLEGHKSLHTFSLKAMNTTFYFAVTDCKITHWREIMKEWVHYVEREWSRFHNNNELSLLNHLSIGESIQLSPPLFDVLQLAERYWNKTNGNFSPYLLKQLQFHGYDRPFPFKTSEHKSENMSLVYQGTIGPFEFVQPKSVKRIASGQVDLGGIGKGYTVEAAARWLKKAGGGTSRHR